MGFSGGSVLKNPPADAGDVGSIPEWEISLDKEMAAHSSILAWEIPWIEEPVKLWSMGVTKELDMSQQLNNNKLPKL